MEFLREVAPWEWMDLEDKTVKELKELCKAVGVPVTGSKAVLLQFLANQSAHQKKKKGAEQRPPDGKVSAPKKGQPDEKVPAQTKGQLDEKVPAHEAAACYDNTSSLRCSACARGMRSEEDLTSMTHGFADECKHCDGKCEACRPTKCGNCATRGCPKCLTKMGCNCKAWCANCTDGDVEMCDECEDFMSCKKHAKASFQKSRKRTRQTCRECLEAGDGDY